LSEFKFLHVADVHLDSPLLGLARYEGVPVDEVRLATRTALTSLVELAVAEDVAFVVIAGDIYDGDWPHFGTGLFFCAAMGRLDKAGIEVYLLYGNHDAQSVLTKKLPLPPNVHVFPTNKAKTFVHQGTGAALQGRSYKDRDTRENLAVHYPAAVEGAFNIGILHTALGGRPPHASYAPCSVPELCAKGYQYWALGHVHDFEVVSKSPYIVFPGNLQGRSIRECGPKGAVIVTVQDLDVLPDGAVSPQELHDSREIRNAAWDAIRDHFVSGAALANPASVAKDFARKLSDADELADKRFSRPSLIFKQVTGTTVTALKTEMVAGHKSEKCAYFVRARSSGTPAAQESRSMPETSSFSVRSF